MDAERAINNVKALLSIHDKVVHVIKNQFQQQGTDIVARSALGIVPEDVALNGNFCQRHRHKERIEWEGGRIEIDWWAISRGYDTDEGWVAVIRSYNGGESCTLVNFYQDQGNSRHSRMYLGLKVLQNPSKQLIDEIDGVKVKIKRMPYGGIIQLISEDEGYLYFFSKVYKLLIDTDSVGICRLKELIERAFSSSE